MEYKQTDKGKMILNNLAIYDSSVYYCSAAQKKHIEFLQREIEAEKEKVIEVEQDLSSSFETSASEKVCSHLF